MYCSYFSRDRSGAQLLDILYNYHYCHKHNLEYGGPILQKKYSKQYCYIVAVRETEKLIQFLNIPNIPNKIESTYEILQQGVHQFSNDFVEMLHTSCKPNLINIKTTNDDFIVSIHIRRGDVQKDNRWKFRYTDDEYYLELIKEIYKHKPDAIINVFSESSFNNDPNKDKYLKLGCVLKLGTSLEEAFNYFIQSDIFIMASSAFSILPALYKKDGLVIYTWNKYFTPLEGWVYGENKYNEFNLEEKKDAIKTYIDNKGVPPL